MKKLFYSFLLIIVSFFVLSSCNKNNTNDIEDDSKYQVTKEEFDNALDFTLINHYSISYKNYKKWSDREEKDLYIEGNMIREGNILHVYGQNHETSEEIDKEYDATTYNPLRVLNYSYDDFEYDKLSYSYKGHINDYQNDYECDIEFEFNNKFLVNCIIISQSVKDVISYNIYGITY